MSFLNSLFHVMNPFFSNISRGRLPNPNLCLRMQEISFHLPRKCLHFGCRSHPPLPPQEFCFRGFPCFSCVIHLSVSTFQSYQQEMHTPICPLKGKVLPQLLRCLPHLLHSRFSITGILVKGCLEVWSPCPGFSFTFQNFYF